MSEVDKPPVVSETHAMSETPVMSETVVMSETPVLSNLLSKNLKSPNDFELRIIPVNNEKTMSVEPPEMPVRSYARKSEARKVWGSSTFVIARIED